MWTDEARKRAGETVKQKFADGTLKPRVWTEESRRKISETRKRRLAAGEIRIQNGNKKTEIPTIDVDEGFAWHLVGFTDGEGCFAIAKNVGNSGIGLQPVFKIALRADDAKGLQRIQQRMGIGSIRIQQGRGSINPTVVWDVSAQADNMALVEFFTKYPLKTKKARDFAVWADIVRYCYNTYAPRYEDVKDLVDQLQNGRKFNG